MGKKGIAKKKSENDHPNFIVAVGASAGGLEALQDFLSHLPDGLDNISIIIAQHVSPTHKSMLVQLLSRETNLEVAVAADGVMLEPNKVYITPPDKEISVNNGRIKLAKPTAGIGPKPSVDVLFHSLADDNARFVTGIILSGTGTDGASGVRALKEAGGFIIAQEPHTAKYDGMPLAAIHTEAVDAVLSLDKMGDEILEYISNPNEVRIQKELERNEGNSLDRIFELLSKRTGTDFSSYKSATIGRRLQKRLTMLNITSIEEYLRVVEKTPKELDEMFQMILIGVTSFFRDEDSFLALEEQLKDVIKEKSNDDPIRIWVPGCSTGEEPYSIAILLNQLLKGKAHEYNIQIFATDIDDKAISRARKGIYSKEALVNVSKETLDSYFVKNGKEFELIKPIRSMVLFSKHDVTSNPPFLKLDLITCRNLLIYFGAGLQQQIIPIFHYALNPDGLLFLGKSETVGQFTDLFSTIDGKNKLFKRKRTRNINPINFSAFKAQSQPVPETKSRKEKKDLSLTELVKKTLFNSYEHPYVVVDEEYNIRETYGDVRLFLTLPSGSIHVNLLKMVNQELQIEVRSVISKSIRNREIVKSSIKKFELYDQNYFVRITAKPLIYSEETEELFIVIFEKLDIEGFISTGVVESGSGFTQGRIQELELDLAATKEHLQTYIEEIEISNEKLQSLNEELQSTNEELQSTNEEMETTNEELQSTNEEVQITYSELKSTHEELEEKDELLKVKERNQKALLNNTLQAFFLIDRSYKIIAYNSIADNLTKDFRKGELKKGDSIVDLTSSKNLEGLVDEMKKAFNGKIISGERKETDSKGNDRWFAYNITPVSDEEGEVDVVSLGMIDITKQKEASIKLNSTERLLNSVFDASKVGICITDSNGKFVDVNSEYCRIYGYKKEELIGRPFTMMVPPENRDVLQKLHDDFIAGKEELDAEWRVQRSDGRIFDVYAGAKLLEYGDGSRFKVTSVRDLSENKKYRDLLHETQSTANVGGWEFDTINKELSLTEEVFNIFGAPSAQDIDIDVLLSYFKQEAGVALKSSIDRAVENGHPFDLELECTTRLDEKKWVRITTKPIRIHNKTVKLFGTIQDISKRVSADIVQQSEKKKYQALFDNSISALFITKPDGTIIEANEAACKMFGYSKEDFKKIGRSGIIDINSPGLLEKLKERDEKGYAKGELIGIRKNGESFWCDYSSSIFDGPDGEKLGSVMMVDISERKAAEESLRKVMNQSLDVICTIDEKGNFVRVSKASKHVWGYEPEEIIGRAYMEMVHEDDHKMTEQIAREIMEGKNFINFHNRYIRKDGTSVDIVWSARWDADDKLMYCVAKDASELNRAKLEMELLINNTDESFVLLDKKLNIVSFNKQFQNLAKNFMNLSIRKGMNIIELTTKGRKKEVEERYKRVLKGAEEETKLIFDLPNDEEKIFSLRHQPAMDDHSTIIGAFVTAVDVTQEVKARRQLEESNQRFEYVNKATEDVIYDHNLKENHIIVGESFEKVFGHEVSDEPFPIEKWMEFVHPDDRTKSDASYLQALKNPEINKWTAEYRFHKNDGSYANVVENGYILRNKKGKAVRMIGAVRDISGRKREEQRLKLMESVVTNTNDSVLITKAEPMEAPQGPEIIFVNSAFEKMTGYKAEEVIGKTPRILEGPNSDHKALQAFDEKMRRWESAEIETINYKKNGDEFWVQFSMTPLANEKGWYTHWIAIERDITERKNREIRQRLFSEISQIFNETEGVRKSLKQALEILKQHGNFALAEVWMIGHDDRSIELVASLEYEARLFYETTDIVSFAKGKGLPGIIWKKGETQFWKNLDTRKTFERSKAAKRAGLKTAYGLPIKYNNEVTGALILGVKDSPTKPHYFTPILEEIAVQLGDEIHRKELEEELSRIFNSAPDIISIASLEGYFRKVNPAMSELLGYTVEELISRPYADFVHPDDRKSTLMETHQLGEGKPTYYFENRYITKSGRVVWLAWTAIPYVDENLMLAIGKDITGQKELQELLDQSSRIAKIGSWEVDVIEETLFWSDITREIHEVDAEFLPDLETGINFYKKGESREKITEAIKHCIAEGKGWDLELQLITQKGNEKWVRAIGEAELVDGKCVRLYGSFQDIHERKETELAYIRASEERDKILNSISDAFYAMNEQWEFTFFNREAESLLSHKADEVLGRRIWDVFNPVVGTELYDNYYDVMENKVSRNFEYFYPPIEQWFDISAYPAENGIAVYFKNITERKEDQTRILKKTQQLDTIAMFNTLLIQKNDWLEALDNCLQEFGEVVDADRVYYFENNLSKSQVEFTTSMKLEWAREGIKAEIENPAHHNLPFSEIESFIKVLSSKKPFNKIVSEISDSSFKNFLKDQEIKSILAIPVFIGKRFRGFIGFDDCTNERNWSKEEISFLQTISINLASSIENEDAEIALEKAFHEKNEILESIGDGFFAVDKDFTVTYWNNQAEQLLHTPKNKIVGEHLWDIFSDTLESYKAYHRALKEQVVVHFEDYFEPIERWFEISAYPSALGLSIFFKDVTDRKIADQRLKELNRSLEQQAKELAASNSELEQFAFVASHDLQEPLRMITSFLAQLERKYDSVLDEKGKKYIHFATDGAKRMRQIILDLLDYSRVGRVDVERSDVDLASVLDDVMILNRKLIEDKNADISWENMPVVYAAKAPIQQLFQNLVNNALNYQMAGNKPVVKIWAEDEGSHWKFFVKDNGIGINPAYTEKIFNIFQRLHAKEEYSGTGVGLAICKKIVEDHDGVIGVDSEEGKGSTFHFTIAKKQN